MAAEFQPIKMSVEEYFALEKTHPEICYEYVDGYVQMMAGGTFNHDTIKSNIQGILWQKLLDSDRCNVYSSDIKTQINAQERYYHPDVVISCDARDRGTGDMLKSPKVVFEVLSPSAEQVDRVRKLHDYTALSTVQEYILVNSEAYSMEMYRREDDRWVYYRFNLWDELELTSVDLHFPVVEAYRKVVF